MKSSTLSRRLVLSTMLFLAALVLIGCSKNLDGTYTPDARGSFASKLIFKSGGKVEVTAMGFTQEVNYEVEGKKVKISAEGKPATILTIDENGCLDGGEMIGRYCKN